MAEALFDSSSECDSWRLDWTSICCARAKTFRRGRACVTTTVPAGFPHPWNEPSAEHFRSLPTQPTSTPGSAINGATILPFLVAFIVTVGLKCLIRHLMPFCRWIGFLSFSMLMHCSHWASDWALNIRRKLSIYQKMDLKICFRKFQQITWNMNIILFFVCSSELHFNNVPCCQNSDVNHKCYIYIFSPNLHEISIFSFPSLLFWEAPVHLNPN